jgi:hypothetical protein
MHFGIRHREGRSVHLALLGIQGNQQAPACRRQNGLKVRHGDTTTAFLALVVWVIGRVLLTPPHRGMLAWAKICPGRRRAEYHSLDQTSHVYRRRDVPYQRLMVTIVRRTTHYRIEIAGFPREATPVLLRTRDLREAKRCAREAGAWLELPIAA